jgi:hypothetical protein
VSTLSDAATVSKVKVPLTTNQKRSFWAAWGGWAMDGMDSFIYVLVLAPAMRELLPLSGVEATQANVGYYGAVLFSPFMIGWASPWSGDRSPINWPSAHADVHHSLVFRLHLPGRDFPQRLGAGFTASWPASASVANGPSAPPGQRSHPRKPPRAFGGLMHTGYYFDSSSSLANFVITPLHPIS